MIYPKRWAVDCHVHTSFSKDGTVSPLQAIEIARRKGLDAIAITDHDTEDGGWNAFEINPYGDFDIIPGVEVRTDLGDVIALYVKSKLRSRHIQDLLQEIAEQDGMAVLPHPLRTFPVERIASLVREYPAIHAWEVLNGRYTTSQAKLSMGIFEALSPCTVVAGSDAHFAFEIGRTRTLLPFRPASAGEFRSALGHAFCIGSEVNEALVRAGIVASGLIKRAKKGEYRRLALDCATLPQRTLRYLR